MLILTAHMWNCMGAVAGGMTNVVDMMFDNWPTAFQLTEGAKHGVQSPPIHEIKELINKCWITHDGMWFSHALFTQGIDVANQLNRAAIKSMAEVELKRFMKILNVSQDELKDFRKFEEFFMNVQDLLIPEFMNVIISFKAPNQVLWKFNKKGCFAYNGVKRANVEHQYECGPLYRIQSWLEGLDLSYEMKPEITKCIMAEKGTCSGYFEISF